VPVRTEVETFPLEHANQALDALRSGRIRGAGVLVVERTSQRRRAARAGRAESCRRGAESRG